MIDADRTSFGVMKKRANSYFSHSRHQLTCVPCPRKNKKLDRTVIIIQLSLTKALNDHNTETTLHAA